MAPNTSFKNPFILYGYEGPDYFCDRQEETQTIVDAIYNGRNITLISPRRMGKTGLIHNVFHRINREKPDMVTIYIDIYSTRNLQDFTRILAEAVLGRLERTPQKALKRIADIVRSIRPFITFDDVSGVPKVSFDIKDELSPKTLKEVFEYIKGAERKCCIAIDEFQQIRGYPEGRIEAELRSYIQFLPDTNFIFSGSRRHILSSMFQSTGQPFYHSSQIMPLSAIDIVRYYDFSKDKFMQRDMNLPWDVFESLYKRFEGHTWYIHNVLNRLYGNAYEIDEDIVDRVIDRIVEENRYYYEDIFKTYSKGSAKLLLAIAKEGCVKEAFSGNFIRKYGLNVASSVKSALDKLIDNDTVYYDDRGYIIYDRFFGLWLSKML